MNPRPISDMPDEQHDDLVKAWSEQQFARKSSGLPTLSFADWQERHADWERNTKDRGE